MMTIRLYRPVPGVGTHLHPITVSDEIGNRLLCNGQCHVIARDAAPVNAPAGVVNTDRPNKEEGEPAPEAPEAQEEPGDSPAKPRKSKKE